MKKGIILGLTFWLAFSLTGFYINKRVQVTYDGAALVNYDLVPGMSCSAFIVSNTAAVTAGHCAIGMEPGLVDPILSSMLQLTIIQGPNRATGNFVLIDFQRDIALIKGNFKHLRKAKTNFAEALFRMNRTYVSCGYPLGQSELLCVELGYPVGNDMLIFNFLQPIVYGMSGGPVYDQETGYVVGINTYLYPKQYGGGSGFTPVLGLGRYFKK